MFLEILTRNISQILKNLISDETKREMKRDFMVGLTWPHQKFTLGSGIMILRPVYKFANYRPEIIVVITITIMIIIVFIIIIVIIIIVISVIFGIMIFNTLFCHFGQRARPRGICNDLLVDRCERNLSLKKIL